MEQILQNILGIDNYQKYGFFIIFIFGYVVTVIAIYTIVFLLNKIKNLISDKNDKILSTNERIIFIIDKQNPTYWINSFGLPLVFWCVVSSWSLQSFDFKDIILSIFFGLIMLIYTYMFINSFFIKLIVTNQRLLYRSLLNLNYKIISINDIQRVTTCNDYKFGELLIIETKEKSSKISLRVLKNAKEVQTTLEATIYE